MEEITFAPSYVAFYPMLAERARKHKYSLAIHGSVGKNRRSDLDLVAIPWEDDASEPEVLLAEIWEYCQNVMLKIYRDESIGEFYPVDKPHGRRAWLLQIGNGARIDISVMPKHRLEEFSDRELTKIYNDANGISLGKSPPISTQKIFTAMRAMAPTNRFIPDCRMCRNYVDQSCKFSDEHCKNGRRFTQMEPIHLWKKKEEEKHGDGEAVSNVPQE